ncbi:ATP synthase F1 subunit gamma [Ignavigranum ruoffiae]|uniref:ATP synthase F1 subunit gamma n=1 Tax=Ignavigranum ruoffiae TaxID=89093 RepID=UPI0023538147|nr:ATP synthase F1 subunit gamma [Ignavigranum ruoffiae]
MSLFQIKKQIDSINKTKQITNAMRLVSTSKYNRMVQEAKNYDLYSLMVRKLVYHIISRNIPRFVNTDLQSNIGLDPIDYHHMLVQRPVVKTAYLVISSDKGLAGDYNSSLIKKFDQYLKTHHEDFSEIVVLGIGDPIIKYCKANGITMTFETHNISDYPTFTEVQKVIKEAIEGYNNKTYDALKVAYNHSENIMQTQLRLETILPLGNIEFPEDSADEDIDYIIEPDPEVVLDELLVKFVESQIYGAIIDAKTAEQASRMQAMNQATQNAEDLIFNLKKQYNQQRQLRITNEILDIINGSAAQQ